jgi:hypothetical protein
MHTPQLFLGVRKEKRILIGQLRSLDKVTALNALDAIFENGW